MGVPPVPVLPSPPPWGWSTGFMATPRTVGRRPSQRVRPALPKVTFPWSRLPICPMVARHPARILRVQDVALLAVGVVQQGEVGGAVRVVLDGGDAGGDAFLVAAEVDEAVHALVAPAAVPGADAPQAVAPAGPRQDRKN